ncbi:Inositol monophosphatase-like [Dillenia turbinata]|uniref:Inositol monophosphatase-like n=1 Tax=Dillenia turbinata TaxID=194707 RepID=A0AAN8UY00_9MAGN
MIRLQFRIMWGHQRIPLTMWMLVAHNHPHWGVQATVSWVLSESFGSENVSLVAKKDVQKLTKGFVCGDQYAVALALIEDGVVLGANQKSSIDNPALATVCDPVEKANSSHSFTAGLAHSIGLRNQPLRVYGMLENAAIARGDAEVFRKFARAGYKEKIWDHAVGVVMIQEACGVVTEARGHPMDLSKGIYLEGLDRLSRQLMRAGTPTVSDGLYSIHIAYLIDDGRGQTSNSPNAAPLGFSFIALSFSEMLCSHITLLISCSSTEVYL